MLREHKVQWKLTLFSTRTALVATKITVMSGSVDLVLSFREPANGSFVKEVQNISGKTIHDTIMHKVGIHKSSSFDKIALGRRQPCR